MQLSPSTPICNQINKELFRFDKKILDLAYMTREGTTTSDEEEEDHGQGQGWFGLFGEIVKVCSVHQDSTCLR